MLISIVMPTYNGMKYLREAIDSILIQEDAHWELIIADDGSTDGTREYLASLNDPRVRVMFNPKNLGIFGNLNQLFKLAKGNVTQIFCQDDWLISPRSLHRLTTLWLSLPTDIAFIRANHNRDTNSKLAQFESQALPKRVSPEQSDLFFLIFGCIPGNLSNVSVRTHMVETCGWFDVALPYAGDFDFWSRVGRMHPWIVSDMHITSIRQHREQASVTLNLKGELLPQLRHILESLYRNLIKKGHSPIWLRTMISVSYAAQHRDAGIKKLLQSQEGTYLDLVSQNFDKACFSHPKWLGWLIYMLSAGGRLLKISVAKLLLSKPNP